MTARDVPATLRWTTGTIHPSYAPPRLDPAPRRSVATVPLMAAVASSRGCLTVPSMASYPMLELPGFEGPDLSVQPAATPGVDLVAWDPATVVQPETVSADLDEMLRQAAPRLLEAHTLAVSTPFAAVHEELDELLHVTRDLRDLSLVCNDEVRTRIARALPVFVSLAKARAMLKGGALPGATLNGFYAHLFRVTLPWVAQDRPASPTERAEVLGRMARRTFDAESNSRMRRQLGDRLEAQVEQATVAAGYVRHEKAARHHDPALLPVGTYSTRVMVLDIEADLAVRTSPTEVLLVEAKVATDPSNSRRRVREIKDAYGTWSAVPGYTTLAVLDGAYSHGKVRAAVASGVKVLCAHQLPGLTSYLRRSAASACNSSR